MLKIIAELTSPKSKHRKSLGFTLIEVLVTISIIGMLSSVASVSAKSARVNARDTRRIQEVENIQKAIELYYADNGTYPFLGVSADPTVNIAYRSHSGSWNDLAARLNPYTKILNVSPAQMSSGVYTDFQYYNGNTGITICLYGDTGISEVSRGGYAIFAYLENPNNFNARNDKGIMSQAYELYGGEFWMNEPSSCD